MKFETCGLPGVILIDPDVFRDARGYFLETYHVAKYRSGGLPDRFVQDNHSRSSKNTLRGLHLQLRKPQGKLVRVVTGEIWDVAADVRPQSPTFGMWAAEVLSGANFRQLYIPPGFAHGFCVLSDEAHVEYKCTEFYDAEDEIGIAHDDPTLSIRWPISTPLLSNRDAANRPLAEARERLADVWRDRPLDRG